MADLKQFELLEIKQHVASIHEVINKSNGKGINKVI